MHYIGLSCSTEIRFCQTRLIRVIYIVFNEKNIIFQEETKMEETKNTENFEEVLDENEESKIEEPAKESKFKKAVSKAKDKIKDVKVTTVLKAVAVGAGLVAAYTLGSRHVEDEDGAVAENDYVELEDLSGDSGESKETEE
nr:MAG TPA: hypothetical protein [Caudoviricetes sp.]